MAAAHLIGLLILSTVLQQVRSWKIEVPKKITAVEGSCVVVPCKTEPHSRVTWYQYHSTSYPVVYDGLQPRSIEYQFRGRTSVPGNAKDGNCTLRINDVRTADNNIKVYAWIYPDSNANQRFYDQTVTIVVERKTPIISIQGHIVAGEFFQANCSVYHSCPFSVPSLHWNISTMKNSTLIVLNEEVNDQWLYTKSLYGLGTYEMHNTKTECSAQFNTVISQQITLNILYKPVAVNLTAGKEPVMEGGSITTECAAISNPQPHMYLWLKRQMGQITTINSTERKMSFGNITRDTSVSCIAHNEIGVGQSAWLDLDVEYVPAILPESSCHLTEELLRCFCRAKASPNASIYWTVDGNGNVTLPFSFSFVSTNKKNVVAEELHGPARTQTNVSCTAWNSLGSDTSLLFINNLSKTDFFPKVVLWSFTLLVLGAALLFGCAIFIYRNCHTNRPQGKLDNVQLQQTYSPQRSQDKDTQSGPCKPHRYAEEDRLSCVYDNDCIEEFLRPMSNHQCKNEATALQREDEITGVYSNMDVYSNC